MKIYMLIVAVLRFVVVLLLLIGAKRLCYGSYDWPRCLLAAGIGGLYAWACLLPELNFLGNTLWYIVFLTIMGSICFGWKQNSARSIIVFILLNLVLDSIVSEGAELWRALLGVLGLVVLCILGSFGGSGGLVPVHLTHGDKKVSVMALRDTGNTLTDPVTGKPMLVIGAQVANKLTGLTEEQLKKPVESVGLLPGLRLVPYSTIGRSGALMLAMRLQEVTIGSWKGSGLVAFAPECLGSHTTYQALTGGTL